ncbi:hypothetical protein BG842_05305 [Haladaptatus sp. W1]|nr:hypothetical protein BG842_05305 [Haladaptatus sp. W1]
MDTVRRFIAQASNRSEDQIEKADTALAGVAMQLVNSGSAASVTFVTTDTDAGKVLCGQSKLKDLKDK